MHREVWLGRICIAVTVLATLMLLADVAQAVLRPQGTLALVEHAVFAAIVCLLIYGNLVYQACRLGHFRRKQAHVPASAEALDRLFSDATAAPSLAILVPAYKEEPDTVRQTLLSAALQHYPNRRVALLIDDAPAPTDPADAARLAAVRCLPGEIASLLESPSAKFAAAESAFRRRSRPGAIVNAPEEMRRLAGLYGDAAAWFERQADERSRTDHTDRLFADKVLRAPARSHRDRSAALARAADRPDAWLTRADLATEYARLAAIFRVELTGFERKGYANLSHEPNKAMNLNAYIGLLGRRLREVVRGDGVHLVEARGSRVVVDLEVPDADYLVTLDADSLLLPDYALRLVEVMEQPGNERVAVTQTPYRAVPGAPGVLERVAGATTDVQLIIHQGFTHYDATFWVGANALLRRAALEDIRRDDRERGHPIARFIQDRTVIEDTESTIDLIDRGWRLYNYPDHLAYSATPPDFGSLVIQRCRWANGGLIVLPKLVRHVLRAPGRRKLVEGGLRLHYLGSLAWGSVGLPVLLFYPFGQFVDSAWLPVAAAPYFLLYGRDLVQNGYCWTDLLRVYALNLLLVVVHLSGVLKSLQQAWTRRKIPFGRTPKVVGRTAAPASFVVLEFAILGFCLLAAAHDALRQQWSHAAFALANGAFLAYALVAFVGLRAAAEDVRAGLAQAWQRPRTSLGGRAPAAALPPVGNSPIRAPSAERYAPSREAA